MAIYLVTYSDGTPPDSARSLSAARRYAQRGGPLYFTRAGEELYGYRTRADMARDDQGSAPHLVAAVIHTIRDPARDVAMREWPDASLKAIRESMSYRELDDVADIERAIGGES